jgi:hypothetical protein
MSEPRAEFKRMLVGLPRSASDYAAVAATAQLADLLGLSLVATFIQDTGLADLAALPCVRELRPFGGGWQQIDIVQIERQLEHAAAAAQRLFQETVQTAGIEASFCVAKGSLADVMGSSATADDIVVIIEPRNPADRITQQFTRLIDAAFEASTAVMLVPSRITRTVGPIVVVMMDPDDPSLPTALTIAAAIKERVVVLGQPTSEARASIAEMARIAGVRIEVGPTVRNPLDVSSLVAHLAYLNERLVVMSRSAVLNRGAPMVASVRGVPVLLTEPHGLDPASRG